MCHPIIDELLTYTRQAPMMYYQLIIIVGKSGKTTVLRKLGQHLKVPVINLSLELSKNLLMTC
ncbi:MAG: hypothetical protein GX977_10515 [Firmicutes bacterium]|nr:hypothetical protein [Bacillota bacterium]